MEQGDFPISSYELQYQRVDDNDVEADQTTPTSLTGVTQSLISRRRRQWHHVRLHENIPGGATFHYRVRAVNGRGAGDWFPTAERKLALTRVH